MVRYLLGISAGLPHVPTSLAHTGSHSLLKILHTNCSVSGKKTELPGLVSVPRGIRDSDLFLTTHSRGRTMSPSLPAPCLHPTLFQRLFSMHTERIIFLGRGVTDKRLRSEVGNVWAANQGERGPRQKSTREKHCSKRPDPSSRSASLPTPAQL